MMDYHNEQKAVFHHLRNSEKVFVAMEDNFPNELTYDWLESSFETYGKAKSWKSLTGFLVRKKLIQMPSENSKYRKQCMKYVIKLPENFQKCINWYIEDKFALQERQIANNAKDMQDYLIAKQNIDAVLHEDERESQKQKCKDDKSQDR